MPDKMGHNSEAVGILLLVGSHSVSSALLTGKQVSALSEALTVCACIVIFMGVSWLAGYLGHSQPKASAGKRRSKRSSKKVRAGRCSSCSCRRDLSDG